MIEGTSTRGAIIPLILAIIVLGGNGYLFFGNIETIMLVLAILFGITLTLLTILMSYERIYKKPLLDAKDNIGTSVIIEDILGKEIYSQYKKIKSNLDYGHERDMFNDLVNYDIQEIISAYEIVKDFNSSSETVKRLDIELGIRSKIKTRLDMLEDTVFSNKYKESLNDYSRRNMNSVNYTKPEYKKLIEEGYQENGFNINDKFYTLKSANLKSTQFKDIAHRIVLESLDKDIKEALLA